MMHMKKYNNQLAERGRQSRSSTALYVFMETAFYCGYMSLISYTKAMYYLICVLVIFTKTKIQFLSNVRGEWYLMISLINNEDHNHNWFLVLVTVLYKDNVTTKRMLTQS